MNAYSSQFNWLKQPSKNHILQFYPDDDVLIRYLQEFIYPGLVNQEACIVIATEAHIEMLDKRLMSKGIDLRAARAKELYVTADARQTLAKFMKAGMPDWNLFSNTVSALLDKPSVGGKPIRAYGEMVALLWEDNNPAAVLELEKFWEDMVERYSFSLFCGYPARNFGSKHAKIASEIHKHHSIVI